MSGAFSRRGAATHKPGLVLVDLITTRTTVAFAIIISESLGGRKAGSNFFTRSPSFCIIIVSGLIVCANGIFCAFVTVFCCPGTFPVSMRILPTLFRADIIIDRTSRIVDVTPG
jgi:hypothetical protein